MEVLSVYGTAFVLGLFGSAHCLGMCGGIMAALGFAVPESNITRRLAIMLSYNSGRILSYCLIGAIGGWLGSHVAHALGIQSLRLVAAFLMIAMGLYLADWWRGLTYLEKLGSGLWRLIKPLANKFMPVTSVPQGLMLGALWGWLPCGLVYTALAYAVAQAGALESAGVMLAFGLGTLPAVLAGGIVAEKFKQVIQSKSWRSVMGILVMGFGIWTLWFVLAHAGHAGHTAVAAEQSVQDDSTQHHHHQMAPVTDLDSTMGPQDSTMLPQDSTDSTSMPAGHHHH